MDLEDRSGDKIIHDGAEYYAIRDLRKEVTLEGEKKVAYFKGTLAKNVAEPRFQGLLSFL